MNQNLQNILDAIQQNGKLGEDEKNSLLKALKDADKELEITAFKLERTEKVKKTTAILLEETIEELEQKRIAVEIQNRELEIEAALERVRAVAMSMNKSDDLLTICEVSFKEFKKLGFDNLRNTIIHILNDEKGFFLDYDYSDYLGGSINNINYNAHPVVEDYLKQIKKADDAFAEVIIDGTELDGWKDFRRRGGQQDDPKLDNIPALYYYLYSIGVGDIGISALEPINESQIKILKRFRNVFDLAYRRYTDIAQAEAQAREAQIEAALEKVRAVAMAMRKPEDLLGIGETVFNELKVLGFDELRNTEVIINNDSKESVHSYYFSDYGVSGIIEVFYKNHPTVKIWAEEMKKASDAFAEVVIPENEIDAWRRYREEIGYKPDPKLNEAKTVYYYSYSIGLGALSISSFKPVPEEQIKILERFRNVFNLSYQRYVDIALAEAQAREAQIELALERVRARTMAMHKTDELQEVVRVVAEELKNTGVILDTWGAVICTYFQDSKDVIHWTATDDPAHPSVSYLLPYFKDELFDEAWASKNSGADYFAKVFSYDVKNAFFNYAFEHSDYRQLPDEYKKNILESKSHGLAWAWSKNSAIMIPSIQGDLPSEEEKEILIRFAKVFEQAFIRFLDLKKAEAQAREAQIEAALERVRTNAMAMQSSIDFAKIVEIVFTELKKVGFETLRCGIGIIESAETKKVDIWSTTLADEDLSIQISGDEVLEGHPLLDGIIEHWINQTEFSYVLEGEDFLKYYKTIEKTNFHLPDYVQQSLSSDEKQYYYMVPCKAGGIYAFSLVPFTDEVKKLMRRFIEVFQLAYTRYVDLQKAEAQAREAQIELALERVRARTMAMHKSDELKEVIRVVYEQFVHLKINVDHAGFVVDYTPKGDWHFWIADEQDIPSKITHPYFESVWANQFNEAKEKGIDFFATNLNFEEKNKFYNELLSYVPGLPEASKDFYLSCPGLAILTALLENVSLYIENFSGTPYTNEENKILRRFGKVFQQTYTRFLDLQRAEAQAREAQIEAALERVRSRSLAMHKSDELNGVVTTIFEKLKELQIEATSVGIGIIEDSKDLKAYVCGENDDGIILNNYYLPYFEHKIFQDLYRACEQQLEFSICTYSKEEKDSFYKIFFEQATGLKNLPEDIKKMIFDSPSFTLTTVPVNNAVFNINDFEGRVLAESEIDIIKRFARVFDQAYTRFLDLQKAEAQAKESQIQLALERVRARTMAMQRSDELKEVVANMFDGLKSLGVDPTVCNISLIDKKTCDSDVWSAHQTDTGLITYRVFISHFEHPFRKKLIDSFLNKISFSVHELSGDLKKSYIQYLIDRVDYSKVPDEVTKSNEKLVNIEEGIVLSAAYMKYGLLIVSRSHAISDDESDILQRFAKIFEQTYTRFLDLQRAEAQAREAQIELALERVRARTMAMQQSDELSETARVLFQQFKELGEDPDQLSIGIVNESEKVIEIWLSLQGNIMNRMFKAPIDEPTVINKIYTAWKEKRKSVIIDISGDELERYHRYVNSDIDFKDYNDVKNRTGREENRRIIYTALFSKGLLSVATHEPRTEETIKILERFAGVFDGTYTRFLDLQKAEAQAREAQIEASLEKVRSRSLAMHKSDELNEVVAVLFEKLKDLQIPFTAVGIATVIEGSKDMNAFVCGQNEAGLVITNYRLPYFDNPIPKDLYGALEKQLDYYVGHYSKEEKDAFYNYVIEHTAEFRHLPEDIKRMIFESPTYTISMVAVKNAVFNINDFEGKVLAEHEVDIIKRFARVFDQAYTRFLDLQRAEAQAREAQIEVSLEKVRTVALSLKKSDEMLDIAQVLYEQLIELGFTNIRNAIIDIHNDKNETFLDYDYSHDMGRTVTLMSYYDDPIIEKQVRQIESSSDAFFELILEGQELQDLIDVRLKNGEEEDPRLRQIDQLTYNLYSFGNGAIGISNFGLLSDEQKIVLKRFRNVFAFAYKRYTDMVSAETQAREAKKQASLDRIRAEIASMRTSEDLNHITPIIWRELKNLEVPFIRCGVFIVNEETENVQVYLTTPDGKSIAALNLSFDANELTSNTVDYWRKKQVLKEHWNKKEFINWTKSMIELGQVQNAETYQGSSVPPESLDLHFVPFTQGMLYVGDVNPLSDEKLDLVKTLAEAFSIAYARYEDFKNLEEAKNKIEVTLKELKSAQAQLVHSEKMASLGELTAGIAHEIKNPLNFVNNFSDLSRELIDDVKEELQKNNTEEVLALLEDLKQNLEKINQHGKRADSIVKGMLLHSRGSSGEKTLTDINDLLDQYVNLAYHGMRAQDKEFNISIEKDYDKTLEKINVVPQDLSRVFLNIINNACYAAYDRKRKSNNNDFSPTLKVSTKNLDGNVQIKIGDNGNGIPANILDKIFQPFFTTKPTGEGTGLGLSLSYDIVTKVHGGELKVETKEGEYTMFTITLSKL